METSGVKSKRPLESVLSMKGGDDNSSFACNSLLQRRFTGALLPLLEAFVKVTVEAFLDKPQHRSLLIDGATFRVADTGCAIGDNTYTTIDTIVRSARACFSCRSIDSPLEFQAYFCDLPSNDFNTLLRDIPPLSFSANYNGHESPYCRSYFAAAVAGSHHNRLHPSQSLHFCHSSIALQWLSRVPKEVEDRNSRAWNSGHIFVSTDEVAEAYLNQFTRDFTSFLRCRAEELVTGGGLFVALLGRQSSEPRKQDGIGKLHTHMEIAFKEMVHDGVIEERVLDEFNIAEFAPTVEELEKIIAEEKSFERKDVRLLTGFPLYPKTEVREGEEIEFGISVEMVYRSLMEGIVRAHLSPKEELTEDFFGRIRKRASQSPAEFLCQKDDVVVACLIRR